MMVVGGRDRFFLDLGPTVAPLLFAVVGVEILRRGDLLPLSPVLVEVSKIISHYTSSNLALILTKAMNLNND